MSQRTGGGKEVLTTAAVAVGVVGVGVALAGLGLAALPGATLGVLGGAAVSNSFARRPKPPLRPEEVRRDEEGRLENWGQLLRAVQHGGVAPELRAELWPALLGVFPPDSTQAQRDTELERLRRLYIKLVLVCRELDAQLAALRSSNTPTPTSGNGGSTPAAAANGSSAGSKEGGTASATGAASPSASGSCADLAALSTQSEAGSTAASAAGSAPPPLPGNLAAFAEAHRIIVLDALRTDLRASTAAKHAIGGSSSAANLSGPTLTVLPVATGDGIPELMMVSPGETGNAAARAAASSEEELEAIAADPSAAAAAGRLPRWRSPLAADVLWGAAHLEDDTRGRMLRLVNILSAYAVHDPETGYCQGMSDLASIFVQLFEDDALAFACFERLMRSARRNFRHDETGIRHQLQQIARVLRDTDPSLFAKLQQLGAEDCMFAYRMVVVMLRRELPPAACCTLWEMQWAHEAAEAEAAAALSGPTSSGLSSSSSRGGAADQQLGRTASRESADGGGSSSAAASAGLRSTVQGLSDATAAARAGHAAASAPLRPGSGRQQGGGVGGTSKQLAAAEAPPEFVMQFIAAVVRAQRGKIMVDCREHDDVLRLFSSIGIEFWAAVAQARKQHRAYVGRRV